MAVCAGEEHERPLTACFDFRYEVLNEDRARSKQFGNPRLLGTCVVQVNQVGFICRGGDGRLDHGFTAVQFDQSVHEIHVAANFEKHCVRYRKSGRLQIEQVSLVSVPADDVWVVEDERLLTNRIYPVKKSLGIEV